MYISAQMHDVAPIVDEEAPTVYELSEYCVYYAYSSRMPARPVWGTPKRTVSHEDVERAELEFHEIEATCPICSCTSTHCGGSTRGPVS